MARGAREGAPGLAAGLLAVPEWTGQAFFNSKDVPAAAGYTLVTVALLLALGRVPEGQADYWLASAPEALSRVPADAELLCSARLVAREDEPATLTPCGGDQFDPFVDRRGEDVRDGDTAEVAGTWVIARRRAGNRAPEHCDEVDAVTRPLRGERVKMAFVLRCG